jgi:hypothetical protein
MSLAWQKPVIGRAYVHAITRHSKLLPQMTLLNTYKRGVKIPVQNLCKYSWSFVIARGCKNLEPYLGQMHNQVQQELKLGQIAM